MNLQLEGTQKGNKKKRREKMLPTLEEMLPMLKDGGFGHQKKKSDMESTYYLSLEKGDNVPMSDILSNIVLASSSSLLLFRKRKRKFY